MCHTGAMPKRTSRPRRPTDVNQWARQVVEESTGQLKSPVAQASSEIKAPATPAQISAFMSEMGRKGGKIGGKRRMETLTAKRRTAIAKKAAKVRWSKR